MVVNTWRSIFCSQNKAENKDYGILKYQILVASYYFLQHYLHHAGLYFYNFLVYLVMPSFRYTIGIPLDFSKIITSTLKSGLFPLLD